MVLAQNTLTDDRQYVILLQATQERRIMAPTIRIDAEVWAWLSKQARPFEDTPNSVLRRIAGLDEGADLAAEPARGRTDSREGNVLAMTRAGLPLGVRVTGRSLNELHRLGARHALYHQDGTFYERLERFPGALCDPGGWVRYDTEMQFQDDPNLRIGRKVNVPRGLVNHPRYQRFKEQLS